MAKIISVAGQKGGCGKSTATVVMASTLAYKYKKNVVVIDCDTKQHTIVKSRQEDIELIKPYKVGVDEEGNDIMEVKYIDIYKNVVDTGVKAYPIVSSKLDIDEVIGLFEKYDDMDYILVDMPGSIENYTFFNIIQNADYVFIPFIVDQFDFDSNYPFAKIIYEKIYKNPETRLKNLYFFWNRFDGKVRQYLYSQMVGILNSEMPEMKEVQNKIAVTGAVSNPHCRCTLIAPMGKYAEWGNVANTIEELCEIVKA